MKSVLALTCVAVLGSIGLARHENHTSETTVDVRRDGLELACRLDSFELELALSLREERSISLEKTEGVEELVAEYVEDYVFLERSGERIAPEWVGFELEGRAAWLYFEFAQRPAAGTRFTHGLLFDVEEKQVNEVTFRKGAARETVRLAPKQPSTPLPAFASGD